jgi:formamidopyrimidine-DNA glycosylase
MIELPEATVLARQVEAEFKGRHIVRGIRGNAPHKFAFYTGEPEEYARIMQGKTIGAVTVHGSCFALRLEPGYALVLGGGGERILSHASDETLPKKHHLLLEFDNGSYLSVSVQGWGSVQLVPEEKLTSGSHAGLTRVSPLDKAFTAAHVRRQFAAVPPTDPRSIKYFVITDPGVWGVGNGYLQDILFRARLHPRRRAVAVTKAEQATLHEAIRATIREAVEAAGRDTERDLYNQPGRYVRIMDSRTAGHPCPECATPIEKASYLGGSVYFCPQCQT